MASGHILSVVRSSLVLWQYNPECNGCEKIRVILSKSLLLDGKRSTKSERWRLFFDLRCVRYDIFRPLYNSCQFLRLPFIEGGVCSCLISAHHEDNSTADDEDVLEEENAVKLQQTQGAVDTNVAVQIHGIKKTYPGTYNIGCCCKCKKSAPYHALKVNKHILFYKF